VDDVDTDDEDEVDEELADEPLNLLLNLERA
jgi:hypothetical protein